MADAMRPGRSPVGETFEFSGITARLIGAAGDVRSTRLDPIGGFAASEGCGKGSRKEVIRCFQTASASAMEVESHLHVASDLGHLPPKASEHTVGEIQAIQGTVRHEEAQVPCWGQRTGLSTSVLRTKYSQLSYSL